MIVFPFTRSSDGERQLDGPYPGLFNLQHLKVEGWHLASLDAFPKLSSEATLQRKQIVYSFSSQSTDRRTNKQRKKTL